MNSWKVILATVVIFGAGVLTGGLLVNYVEREHRAQCPLSVLAGKSARTSGGS